MLWSSRTLSNGSTSTESLGLTPAGGPAGRRATTVATMATSARTAPARRARRFRRRLNSGTGVGVPPSAARNSEPDWNRSPGALASTRMMPAPRSAGHSGRMRVSVVGCSEMCFDTTTRFGPTKGGCPATISYATTPSE